MSTSEKNVVPKKADSVVSCRHWTMMSQTLLNAGSEGQGSVHRSSLPLEIILSGDVNRPKVGDELLLQILYQCKPLKGAKFSATDEMTALQQEGKWV